MIQQRRNHKLPCVHNKHKVQCSMLHDWGVILRLLQKAAKEVFFQCLHKNYFNFKDNLISKVTKTEMHHENHQMQVIRLTEL